MKFVVDGYEIEIKAKYEHTNRNASGVAMAFMNKVSLLYDEVAELYDREGNHMLAEYSRRQSKNLYDQLNEAGYYD